MTQKKGGQIRQLQEKLNSNQLELKLQAIRRIIDAMTRGKDVSMLFMDVIKNIVTPSLQLKKLIYLYIMNYAKNHPDLAILGINSFRKDSIDKTNPFLRALAVRTMGCIRIKQIAEYLCDPLKLALKDEDSYVRKTAVLCVPKLYQLSPELIDQQGFLKWLENLLNDGNAMVVSNTVAALMICSQIKGTQLLKLTAYIVQKLLTAMNDCNQWGIIYILDALSTYIPTDYTEAQSIMQRISARLAHTNSAVSLSAIRLIMKYMDFLTNPESIRNYSAKISAPLITLLSREPQIAYITLKTINLVLQKRPLVIPKQIKIFFIKYHDPSYIKLQKLEILAKVANNDNINLILHQLKQYSQQVDVEFVRKSIRVIGRCAIKLQKMADKCVQALWEALKTKVNYVVQQAIIVIRDIFRKYPNKYQALLKDICQNLKSLDDPEAKASIVWIIGQYVEMIENADQLLANFTQNFKDQPDVVQQQILISCVKLFLLRPQDGQDIVKGLLKTITTQCENPDLRDRGFIYWRLIATNPGLAKKVVFSERPLISEQSYVIETELLDKLIQNIGTLSSVYYKQPEAFVKRLKDNANAKQVLDEDGQQLLPQQGEKVQFFQNKTPQVVSFAKTETNQSVINNNPQTNQTNDLLDSVETEVKKPETLQKVPSQRQQSVISTNLMDDDMLGINSNVPYQKPPVTNPNYENKKNTEFNLLQDNTQTTYNQTQRSSINYNTNSQQSQIQPPQQSQIQPPQQSQIQPPQQSQIRPPQSQIQSQNIQSNIFFQNANNQIKKNIVIPLIQTLNENQLSTNNKVKGLSIKAAFQRENDAMLLELLLQNRSNIAFTQFAMKFNINAFALNPEKLMIDIEPLNPGQSNKVKVPLNLSNQTGEIKGYPFQIQVALKTNNQLFIFNIPCCLSILMVPNASITIDRYKQLASNPNNVKKQQSIPNKLELQQFVNKLADNNVTIVFRKQNNNNELMSFSAQLVNGIVILIDCIFDKSTKTVNIQITAPYEKLFPLVNHALLLIVNL